MNIFKKISIISLAIAFTLGFSGLIKAATTVSLGAADSFAILAGTGITIEGAVNTSTITGDIGSYETATITGLGNAVLNGTNHAGDATTQLAKTALTTAYGNAGQGATQVATELGSTTKFAGVYDSADGTFGMTGTLTLDGQGDPNAVFIFRTASTLITAGASSVNLINSAQACNVFWQVGSSATLGSSSTFKGNILALTSIGLGTTANVEGRVLARNGAVTLDGTNVITTATCAAAPAGPTSGGGASTLDREGNINVVKIVINDNGGTKTVADFPLFVNNTLVISGVTNVFPAPAGAYVVTETTDPNYTRTFSGDCDSTGRIGLSPGSNAFCIVTNNDIGAPIVIPPVPPLIEVVKVPSPLALPLGAGAVVYTYTLSNIGTVPVTNITMVGDTCSPIILVSGDINNDSRLNVNETWVHRCSTTLTATHTNTVVATGWANGISAVDIASATVVVGVPIVPPLIHVTKIPSPLALPAGGGMVTYTKKITNPGLVPLTNVHINDDKCGPVEYLSGDTNKDAKLDTVETWTFTCRVKLTKTTVNTAFAEGEANGLIARDFAIATVVVADAVPLVPKLPNAGIVSTEKNVPGNIAILAGSLALISAALFIARRKRTA